LKPFDTSDVYAACAAITFYERQLVRANELRARAFARGYCEAVDTNGELIADYKERLCRV
jgi:hypothetical protein